MSQFSIILIIAACHRMTESPSYYKCVQGRSQDFILTEAKGYTYTGGLGAEPPAGGGLGAEPLVGRSGGEAPLKLKAFQ